ncbi:MAG: DUF2179 domain-containing protein [Leptolyngbyaceae bacterium]|nr:DUF2179 domain-containing protein [Leptolyngbyaceae bacterium]
MLGSTIDGWLALGNCIIRVIAATDAPQVAETLRRMGVDVTVLNATGAKGDARLTFCILPKRRKNQVLRSITAINPEALVSVDTVTKADLRAYALSRQEAPWIQRLI